MESPRVPLSDDSPSQGGSPSCILCWLTPASVSLIVPRVHTALSCILLYDVHGLELDAITVTEEVFFWPGFVLLYAIALRFFHDNVCHLSNLSETQFSGQLTRAAR